MRFGPHFPHATPFSKAVAYYIENEINAKRVEDNVQSGRSMNH